MPLPTTATPPGDVGYGFLPGTSWAIATSWQQFQDETTGCWGNLNDCPEDPHPLRFRRLDEAAVANLPEGYAWVQEGETLPLGAQYYNPEALGLPRLPLTSESIALLPTSRCQPGYVYHRAACAPLRYIARLGEPHAPPRVEPQPPRPIQITPPRSVSRLWRASFAQSVAAANCFPPPSRPALYPHVSHRRPRGSRRSSYATPLELP